MMPRSTAVSTDDLPALDRWLDACYATDAAGRITGAVDLPHAGVLPRFVLGRSREGVIWRFRHDLPPDLVRGIARLASREQGFPIETEDASRAYGERRGDRPTPPERLSAIQRLMAGDSGTPVEITHEWVEVDGRRIGEVWRLG